MHNNNAARHSFVSFAVAGTAAALLIAANAHAEFESSMALAATGAEELSRDEALAGAMREYHQAYQGGLYDEAAANAAKYIGILLSDKSFSKTAWAEALVHLGNAQRRTADYGAAVENYELAIEALLEETNRLDASLITPYLAAGEALVESGQYGAATGMLEFAVHLQKVNGGLYNIEQTGPLTQLSTAYLKLGDHERALSTQTTNLNVVDQNYPGDDIRKAPAMLAQARILAETGQLNDSHRVYRRTISMIERAEGTDSPDLLPAFYEMVDFITNNDIQDGFDGETRGRRVLQRAIYIAETSETATPVHRADAYIEMGDYLSTNTMNRVGARRNYQKAYRQLATDATYEKELQQRFAQPTLLNTIPRTSAPDMRNMLLAVRKHGGDPDARISVGFDVDESGFPRNIRIAEGVSDTYWSRLAVEHVDRFIFRPQLVDGEAVATEDMRWSFNYRVSDGEFTD